MELTCWTGALAPSKLFGGDGDDSYAVDDADDLITEAIGDGNDTGYFDTNFTLRPGVELENMYVGGFGTAVPSPATNWATISMERTAPTS